MIWCVIACLVVVPATGRTPLEIWLSTVMQF